MILDGTAISLDITHVPRHHRNVHNSSHATSNHYHVAVITSDITSPHSHNVRAQQSQTFTTLAYTQDFTSPTRLRQHRNSQRWTSPVHETASLPTPSTPCSHMLQAWSDRTLTCPGQPQLHVPRETHLHRFLVLSIYSNIYIFLFNRDTAPKPHLPTTSHPRGNSPNRGRGDKQT